MILPRSTGFLDKERVAMNLEAQYQGTASESNL